MIETSASPSAVPPPTKRNLLNWAESHDLALAWTAAFAVGFAAIVLSAGARRSDGLTQQILPLVAMVSYVFYAVRRAHHNRARVADSAYFLGFLWTLATLTVTVLDKRESLAPGDLIQVFAIALSTTGMGLFLRTLLIQFQRTAGDQEQEASDQVDVKVKALINGLEEAERSVKAFTAAMIRSQSEQVARVRQDSLDALASFNAQVTSASRQLTQAIEADVKSIHQGVRAMTDLRNEMLESVKNRSTQLTRYTNRVVEQLGEVAAAVERSSKDLTTAMELASDGILKAPLPHQALEARFAEIGLTAEKMTAKYQEVVARSAFVLRERIEGLAKALMEAPGQDSLGKHISGLTGALDQLTRSAEETTTRIHELATKAHEARGHFNAIAETTNNIGQESGRLLDVLATAQTDTQKAVDSIRNTAANVQRSVGDAQKVSTEIVEFVTKRVSELAR